MSTHAERFWSRVAVGDAEACWEWTGARNNSGYGTVYWQGRTYVTHRVAAYLEGLVPTVLAPKDRRSGGYVLHSCDNRRCCNPRHLFIGSYSENMLDMYAKRRHAIHRGAAHSNARFTSEQITAIRMRYAGGGVRQIDLAAEYGVSQRTISLVVRGETYV